MATYIVGARVPTGLIGFTEKRFHCIHESIECSVEWMREVSDHYSSEKDSSLIDEFANRIELDNQTFDVSFDDFGFWVLGE